jgi:putative intracellular protease/amidase
MKTVHLFVFDTLSDWETGFATAWIASPGMGLPQDRFTVETVAETSDPVRTAGGLRILPDHLLGDLNPNDSAMLILPGGGAWDEGKHQAAAEKAGAFLAADRPVAAICGATSGLARAGLLDTYRHTSNALEYLVATGYAGERLYADVPAITDGNLITAGAVNPIEFAREIFLKLDLFPQPVLDAWYGLFKTGEAAYFYEMALAASEANN